VRLGVFFAENPQNQPDVKVLKDSASPLVCNEKNVLVLGSVFFVGEVISGVGFWPLLLRLPDPGPNC